MAVLKKIDKQLSSSLNTKKIFITTLITTLYGFNYLIANNVTFEKKPLYNKTFVNPPSSNSGTIILPIEVLGAEGAVVSRSFTLDQVTVDATKSIWFMINNLSYENKASIKINNGNWLSLSNLTVKMQKQELLRGGMTHGGFNTVRLTIPKTGLVAGANTIQFRFNKSDGISIGYRVVRMNLLDTNDIRLLASTMFEEENPNNWIAPLTDQASINKGKDLWNNANLWNHYLPSGENGSWYGQKLPATRPIKAKCASCHTQDGRDLEMFSYSNLSIIERTKFHKLTEEEGKQIASYIRSLSQTTPNVGRYGRPWNPPYQPGPALKTKPINQWAAGAGIDAVLAEDKDMAPYLFPNGITKETVKVAFDSDKMDDRTILPLAIQFPDWKHWLPMIHPIDAYTKNNYIEDPARLQKPLKAIETLRTYMQAQPPASRDKKQLLNELRNLWWPFRQFFVEGSTDPGHWRTKDGTANMNLAVDVPREFAATSLARLLAVKNFEVYNEFELQDKASWFVKPEDQPSERQWPSSVYSVFEVPAHFQACVDNDCQQFKGQAKATGQYETTAWYNLQYVLNGGNGFVGGTVPTDFNYHAPFIAYASVSSGIPEPLRYYSSLNQMYQIRSWSGSATGPGDKGFRIRNQGPFHFLGIHQTSNFYYNPPEKWLHFLDDVKPGLSLWVLEAQLLQFLKEVQKTENSLNTWPRVAPHGDDYALDTASKSTIVDIASPTQKDFAHYADKMYYIIPKLNAEGVDCAIMNPLIDWCKKAWPLINFESLRRNCGSSLGIASIGEVSNKDIIMFPNPTNASLTIEIPNTVFYEQAEISICDFLGRKLLTQKTTQNHTVINTINLPSGSYVVKVLSNEILYTKIFMKE
jgi:Secretion system C-terminal sorting domain